MSHAPDPDAVAAAEAQIKSLIDSSYDPQSPRNKGYNCFAWAARDSHRVWAPPGIASWTYWPDGIPTWETLATYEMAYATEDFEPCGDGEYVAGVEKIAIFTDENAVPVHAARQLPCGRWTSKLGQGIDIEHDLETLDGDKILGTVSRYMQRPSPGAPPPPPGPLLILPEDGDPLFDWGDYI